MPQYSLYISRGFSLPRCPSFFSWSQDLIHHRPGRCNVLSQYKNHLSAYVISFIQWPISSNLSLAMCVQYLVVSIHFNF
ncbi:hypothetical protein MtrunA17_Chr6g0481361 [Medicago truncatula]|uniref:Uncharacterized protein n=1 Tax=Medicago truncatula TaxID=3880 RepID=A0A396HGP7_MEDTR|nr:hypothetical protein MtrunA17_Chr6g0481361 [Medicago truncatula]